MFQDVAQICWMLGRIAYDCIHFEVAMVELDGEPCRVRFTDEASGPETKPRHFGLGFGHFRP